MAKGIYVVLIWDDYDFEEGLHLLGELPHPTSDDMWVQQKDEPITFSTVRTAERFAKRWIKAKLLYDDGDWRYRVVELNEKGAR